MNNSDSKEKINDGLINHEGILSNNLNSLFGINNIQKRKYHNFSSSSIKLETLNKLRWQEASEAKKQRNKNR